MQKLLFIFLAFNLLGENGALAQAKAKQEKWQYLFDGKSIKGWTKKGGSAGFTIKNGELIGTCVEDKANTFLCTDQEFQDFIFEAEVNTEGVNTGIQFRSHSLASYQEGRVHGPQLEIDPTSRRWTGGIYDEGRRQWMYIPLIH